MQRHRALVAIDGPAGAGKSTVARRVAASLGFVLVDTGAIYRTVALAATREGLSLGDGEAVGALSERLAASRAIRLVPPPIVPPGDGVPPPSENPPDPAKAGDGGGSSGASAGGSGVRVLLGDDDVSTAIRTPEVSLAASQVSAHPRVRASLLALQRQAGERGGVVLEGRDIGTVVFPDAEVKFFLTANPTVRATRRQLELEQKGATVTFADTLAEVVRRDRADSERPIAPLRRADDALLVDSSGRPVEDVVAEMVAIVRAREQELGLGEPGSASGSAGT